MVVMPDADLDLAVEGALFSGFGTAGQRCTSPRHGVRPREVYDDVPRRASSRPCETAAVGDPTQDVLYGPMISPTVLRRPVRGLARPRRRRTTRCTARPASAGSPSANPRAGFVGDPDAGLFAHPTIVDGVRAGDALYDTETFGPLVGLGVFDDLDEAIELANGHGYGLSSSIYTTTRESVWRFRAAHLAPGMVSVNNSTSGAEAHLPFGGNGSSGNGSRQSGVWVLDQFTRWQSMNWDYSGRLQKAQMDVADLPSDASFRL